MKAVLLAALGIALASPAPAADVAPTPTIKMVMGVCGECHGKDGNSISPQFPKLAGQPRKFMETQLEKMQQRARTNDTAQDYMWGPAHWLSTAQIKEVAEYYSSRRMSSGESGTRELMERGKALFHTKPTDKSADVCTACHGDDAEGGGKAPRLAGQHAHYVLKQLAAVSASHREVPGEMSSAIARLSDADREAIAQYLQGIGSSN